MVVKIQRSLCGGTNIDNLFEFTGFLSKQLLIQRFYLNFSQVRIFCNDDHSKLVPESTQPEFFLP